MQMFNRAVCIKGFEGLLEEGQVYTVLTITQQGHYVLMEVDPPQPYNCFNKDRFFMTEDVVLLDEQEDSILVEKVIEL